MLNCCASKSITLDSRLVLYTCLTTLSRQSMFTYKHDTVLLTMTAIPKYTVFICVNPVCLSMTTGSETIMFNIFMLKHGTIFYVTWNKLVKAAQTHICNNHLKSKSTVYWRIWADCTYHYDFAYTNSSLHTMLTYQRH